MEHIFGRNLMGRWKILNEWLYSLGFLEDAIACMMIATNVELFLRHGNRGRYNPTTPEKIAALNNKAQYHVMQDVRYKYSDPLPSLKDEHAEMEKAIAKNREEHEKADSEEVARPKVDAQARKEGRKRAKEEVDPRITEQAVERRIMKRINDAKRRKNNLEDEI